MTSADTFIVELNQQSKHSAIENNHQHFYKTFKFCFKRVRFFFLYAGHMTNYMSQTDGHCCVLAETKLHYFEGIFYRTTHLISNH